MLFRILLVACISVGGFAQTTTVAESNPPVSTPTKDATDALTTANALLNDGKFADATTAFKILVANDPKSVDAQVGLIRSLYWDVKFDEAEAAARNANSLLPQSALVQATIGDLAFRLGKFADAEAAYRTSLKLDANSARGLFGMGEMFEMVSMHKMAKKAFTRALELDPLDKQILDRWLETLPYAKQLEAIKQIAGDHPTERQQLHIAFLTTAAQKKPWTLTNPVQSAEIKLEPWGRKQEPLGGSRAGLVTTIVNGFGLRVKFNDKASAVLQLDTGSGGIVIGRKLGEKVGVVKIADTYITGVGDQGPLESYYGWVERINIGGLEFRNCVVEVSSKTSIDDQSGLIGADIFSKFLVTLDFKELKIQLAPLPRRPDMTADDDQPQDRYIAPEMKAFTKVWRFGHDLVVPVAVSDKAMGNFILDTGADTNVVTPKIAHQITNLIYEGETMTGVNGRVKEVLNGDKVILQFGRVRVRSDDIPVLNVDNINQSVGTEIAGFIGLRTLVQMKLTIDYRDGLVNFEPYDPQPARE